MSAAAPEALLCEGCVVAKLNVAGSRDLMAKLADVLSASSGTAPAIIAERLTERERVGTTALGGGTAIPHARLPGLAGCTTAFMTLARPLDMAALDGEPVDAVFGLISPEAAGADHLKALAAISRFFRDRELLRRLRGADSDDALLALLGAAGWSEAA
ncbi:MAG TPA: PTS sugar transporter subunit IIA [Paracoccaceae bacterium]|nr:PTS sugar transporter subunit IIA [Paracoccaceae bacterium]